MTADERINALLERAGCPVMVVKSDAPPTPERHMAFLIDRLEVALENALNERDLAADTVRNIVALDVAPVVHARWIDMQEDDYTEGMWRCSACKSDQYFDSHLPSDCDIFYCPNCGARMDGEVE